MEPKTTIGVFGGSFNPVHNGHIALAREVIGRGLADRILFVLSPLNPLKEHPETLVADHHRLAMLRLSLGDAEDIEVSDIELSMPKPSYTINTLERLAEIYPDANLRLLIGADNWLIFDKWKEHEKIKQFYSPIIYPRSGYDCQEALDLGLYDISSTQVRQLIKEGKDPGKFLSTSVIEYIAEHQLYR